MAKFCIRLICNLPPFFESCTQQIKTNKKDNARNSRFRHYYGIKHPKTLLIESKISFLVYLHCFLVIIFLFHGYKKSRSKIDVLFWLWRFKKWRANYKLARCKTWPPIYGLIFRTKLLWTDSITIFGHRHKIENLIIF